MGVWISLSDSGFISLRCTPASGIAGSYGIFIFSFFEESPYYFPQWLCKFTFPPTQWKGSLFFTSTASSALTLCLLTIATQMGMRSYLITVLICISLKISDVEQFFTYSSAICTSSLEKHLFESFAHLKSDSLGFCVFFVVVIELYEFLPYFGY